MIGNTMPEKKRNQLASTVLKVTLSFVLATSMIGFSLLSSISRAEAADDTESGVIAISAEAPNFEGVRSDARDSSADQGKEEVVYAKLSSAGAVNAIYVVNELKLENAGSLTDYGWYDSVVNLTTTEALDQKGDVITARAEAGSFYYEGILTSKDLPWLITLSYSLDGKKVSVDEVAGKSGALEIQMTTKKNPAIDTTFYDNYLLQVTLSFEGEKVRNLSSEGAAIANAGKNKTIVHTIMPGKDGDIAVKAQVEDFEMDGIQVAAMPFSMSIDLPDTDAMLEKMDPLTEAVSEINGGVTRIASGTSELADGVAQLSQGSAAFNKGLMQLSSNSQSIVEGSAQIKQGLTDIAAGMSGGNALDLSDFAQLPGALLAVSGGLTHMSEALAQLRDGYAQAYGSLDAAISAIPAASIDDSALRALAVQNPAAETAFNQLIENYTAAQTVRLTYYGPNGYDGAKAAMEGVVPAINALTDPTSATSLDGMAAGLSEMALQIDAALETMDLQALQQLTEGILQLSNVYDQFHTGLLSYTDGMRFAASAYGEIHSGLVSTSSGANQLASGMTELKGGTEQLNDGVAQLPSELKAEIDKLMDDYDRSDFKPISFVSSKNNEVSLVQFIIATEAIVLEKDPVAEVESEPNLSPLDQLLALF